MKTSNVYNVLKILKKSAHSCSIFALTCFLLFVLYGKSYGAGIGVYGIAGGGQIYYIQKGFWERYKSTSNTAIYGSGFVIDINPAGDALFNYRFKLGYDYQQSDFAATDRLNRVLMTHIFGAGIYRNEFVRIWAGPQIGIGYLWGKNSFYDLTPYNYVFIPAYMSVNKYKHFNLQGGIVLGINITIGNHISLPIEGGLRFNFYTNFGKTVNGRPVSSVFSIVGPEGYASIGVMYRPREETGVQKKI